MLYKSIVFLLILPFLSQNDTMLRKSTERKITKAISKTFSYTGDLVLEKREIPEDKHPEIENLITDSYKIKINEKFSGWVILAHSKGRYDLFDYFILYDTDFIIKHIEILVYRSDHGGEISRQSWLKQFYGYTGKEELKYGNDINAISGATLSGTSITNDIQKISNSLQSSRN